MPSVFGCESDRYAQTTVATSAKPTIMSTASPSIAIAPRSIHTRYAACSPPWFIVSTAYRRALEPSPARRAGSSEVELEVGQHAVVRPFETSLEAAGVACAHVRRNPVVGEADGEPVR